MQQIIRPHIKLEQEEVAEVYYYAKRCNETVAEYIARAIRTALQQGKERQS